MNDVPDVPMRNPRPRRRGYERLRDLLLVGLLATIAVASVVSATRDDELGDELRLGGAIPVQGVPGTGAKYAGPSQPLRVRVVPSPAVLARRERARDERRLRECLRSPRGLVGCRTDGIRSRP